MLSIKSNRNNTISINTKLNNIIIKCQKWYKKLETLDIVKKKYEVSKFIESTNKLSFNEKIIIETIIKCLKMQITWTSDTESNNIKEIKLLLCANYQYTLYIINFILKKKI